MKPSSRLASVQYEIRGTLARLALDMERQGMEIIKLNVGNPGEFGFRMPESMRQSIIRNLSKAEGYGHQKGLFSAREAVVMQCQDRGLSGVSVEHVFIGNGVSELIDLCLRGFLDPGDEVLLPAPDYPLWSAATVLNGGTPVYYPCSAEQQFLPDPEQIEASITPRTRAIVIINPNNPTGANYPLALLKAIADIAERHQLTVLSDEIYDQILYDDAVFTPMATLVNDSLCITLSGLSKVYRACGLRVGWAVFSGRTDQAADYISSVELLSSLRLCANVPGQWAVQTALGGRQSIRELVQAGGRLHRSRQVMVDRIDDSPYMDLVRPEGAMYVFPSVRQEAFEAFDDHAFAMDLLRHEHVLVVPGSSFSFAPRNHFRMTLLPRADELNEVMDRIDHRLAEMQKAPSRASSGRQT